MFTLNELVKMHGAILARYTELADRCVTMLRIPYEFRAADWQEFYDMEERKREDLQRLSRKIMAEMKNLTHKPENPYL